MLSKRELYLMDLAFKAGYSEGTPTLQVWLGCKLHGDTVADVISERADEHASTD